MNWLSRLLVIAVLLLYLLVLFQKERITAINNPLTF